MTNRTRRSRQRISFLLQLGLVLLLLSGVLISDAVAEEEQLFEDGDEEESADEEESDDGDEDEYDEAEYISDHAVDIDPDHDCRDDTYIDCTEVKEKGHCDETSDEDLLNTRALCPVTCGICEMPDRSAVWLDYECFQHNEDITVFFTNTDPEPDDFIGIYPAYLNFTKDPSHLEDIELYLNTCGSLHEEARTAMGGVIFGAMGPDTHIDWVNFPLESGKYKAALVRGDEESLVAESVHFTVKPEGHSCYSECHDLIYTDDTCYDEEDEIHVTFENCVPREDDQIAIYPADEEEPGFHEPLLWLGTCGTQGCKKEVANDIVSFGVEENDDYNDNDINGRAEWPLPPGFYKAFLMRTNEGGRYGRDSAQSSLFTINEEGNPCYKDEEDL
jgi:hypothetical protein